MRPLIPAFLFLISISTSPQASESYINTEMHKASQALIDLMPFIYNDQAFKDPQNKTRIEQDITSLISIIQQTPDLLKEHAVTQHISQQTLLGNLQQAQKMYSNGAYATSQYFLSGIPVICSSCHIQDGQQSTMSAAVDRQSFANEFSFAEFNYYLRNYTQARSAYQAYLQQPAIQRSRIQSRKTLERLLDIALITGSDTGLATEALASAAKLPELDNDTRQTIAQWQTGLEQLNYNTSTLDDLESRISTSFAANFTLEHEFIFNEVNRPKALLWRLKLHQALRHTSAPRDTARALYLLSILERTLGDQVDISLANLYLKECVHLRVSDYSARCLNEYENHLLFYYGGSSGEHLPEDAKQDLRALKATLAP